MQGWARSRVQYAQWRRLVLRIGLFGLCVVVFGTGCSRCPKSDEILVAEDFYTLEGGADTALLDKIKFAKSSAYVTGRHPNRIVDYQIATESQVQQRLRETYRALFFGDPNEQRILYSINRKMAYVLDTGNNDIRSEGMSYAMMIAVMMDDQKTFNKLWRFCKCYMQRKQGDDKGYFAWRLQAQEPYKYIDDNSAPDAEEYFVTALFFADRRWGSGKGILNYKVEANALLDTMTNKFTNSTSRMFDPDTKLVVFSPAENNEFTNPSYHVPAFYELWALWADKNNQYWHEVAEVSRAFLVKASHPRTGLFPEYATFDGEPKVTGWYPSSEHYAYDAQRTIQNIAVDFSWFSQSQELQVLVDRMLRFLDEQGAPENPRSYVAEYTLEGEPRATNKARSAVAMNAVGALAVDKDYVKGFVQDLWQQPTPEGEYRYYAGLLHMMGLLHLSGHFKIYGNPNLDTDQNEGS